MNSGFRIFCCHRITAQGVVCPLSSYNWINNQGLVRYRYPIYGVQFHPESILTPDGKTMLKNFIKGDMSHD